MSDARAKRILVIEDEANIRNNILLMLKVERHNAVGAENGRVGLELARENPPDLILCDINMPEMDGFAVLEALRADPALADVPFVFLTALDDRGSMRRGMNLGADDYIPKPFTRDELMQAVDSRLKKHEISVQAVAARLVPREDRLTQKFRDKISGGDAAAGMEDAEAANLTGKIENATVLFSDIRNFTTYSERLTSGEIADLLNSYLARACEPVIRCGGRIMQFIGDGVMAMFEDGVPGHAEHHAQRAVRAGLGMQIAAHRFRDWISLHHPSRGLPDFTVGVGIHTGEVLMCHVGTSEQGELTAIGDTVNIASRLEGQTKELGWAVVASEATLSAAGPAVKVGGRQRVRLRGRSESTETFEIIGISTGETTDSPVQLPEDMREALAANARIAAGAAKAALGITLRMITGEITGDIHDKPLSIQGYRVQSKIGQGGSSVVYLAERESDGQRVVLKILNANPTHDESLLQRFIQEFDIISSINHPNVVKIYDRGFGERHAYIAMEYFPGGSLTDVIARGLTPRQALSLLAQAAAALREIHNHGVIHRDIKPANLMAREDGTIAVADFGIAKLVGQDLGRTRHGELFGTPYYVSPEQIRGLPATAQSDIYALGVIFYEMLMRKRPFEAENVSELIAQHVNAPRPRLQGTLAVFQQLLDRMLAAEPGERFRNADELIEGIDRVWTEQALRAMKNSS